jgi:DNA-binding transcriptional MerR regulator
MPTRDPSPPKYGGSERALTKEGMTEQKSLMKKASKTRSRARPRKYLRTIDLARAAGVHPNTVRLYEQWGLIPPVARSPSGYRRFTQYHLDCLCLARIAYSGEFPGRLLRRSTTQVLLKAAGGDLGGALELAYHHKALVQAEQAQAEIAAALLERWAQGAALDATNEPLQIGQAAQLLGVSVDMLRNWERNGLIAVPRNPHNRFRRYGWREIGRLRVIRMLSRAGYSLMAILRMLTRLDAGQAGDLRRELDTPRPDEDVFSASDHWLSALADHAKRAAAMIAQLEAMLASKITAQTAAENP